MIYQWFLNCTQFQITLWRSLNLKCVIFNCVVFWLVLKVSLYHSCITYPHVHLKTLLFIYHLIYEYCKRYRNVYEALKIISEYCLNQLSTYHRCSIFFVTQRIKKNGHDKLQSQTNNTLASVQIKSLYHSMNLKKYFFYIFIGLYKCPFKKIFIL